MSVFTFEIGFYSEPVALDSLCESVGWGPSC